MAIFRGPMLRARYACSLFRLTYTDYIYNYVASDKSLSEWNKLEGVADTRRHTNATERAQLSVLGTPKCKLLESRSVRFC